MSRKSLRSKESQPARLWWLVTMVCLSTCCWFERDPELVQAEQLALHGSIPASVHEIEIVYVEGHTPTVSLKGPPAAVRAPSFRPTESVVDVRALFSDIRSFGDCEQNVQRQGSLLVFTVQHSPAGPCGHVLTRQQQEVSVDVLSYKFLHVSGEASGRVTLALADEARQRREENIPIATVTGSFDLRVPLDAAARQMDLRQVVAVVVRPQEQPATVTLKTLDFEQAPAQQQLPHRLGFWVWEYKEAVTHASETLAACQRFGCTRLLVQMPALDDPLDLWRAYVQFLQTVQDKGIEAFALDGAPDAIYHPEPLLEKVHRLRQLSGDRMITGVQLDIEPYLLEGFFADNTGFLRYLAVIERMKATVGKQWRLSLVVPFWLTSHVVQDRPVAFAVMDQADEVAVMSYRTEAEEIFAIAEDSLRYGAQVGVPVWLAVETMALPIERHVVLKREARRDLADAYLDRQKQRLILEPPPEGEAFEWFRVHHRVTVRPERLTFAGQSRARVQATVSMLGESKSHQLPAGVVVHHLTSFLALPE